jgi:uncharacterized membrane protein YphA (DoxX/SURF4 family)
MESAREVWWLRLGAGAGMLVGLLLSPDLWMSGRVYPMTPVWGVLKPLAFPFDLVVYVGWLLVLGAVLVARRSARSTRWIGVFLGMAAILVCFDQSRLQPWFYQYAIMLAALGVCERNPDALSRLACLNTARLILASVYFWSGLQKANPGFTEDVFLSLMEPILRFLPHAAQAWLPHIAPVVPALEVGIGVGLLFRKTRSAAVLCALGMHGFIMVSIGPFGHNRNAVVWPWNLAMAGFLMLLYWRRNGFSARDILWPKSAVFQKAVLVLVAIAPALSFFDLWDNYLSWALYAGNKTEASLYITSAVKDRLPEQVRRYAEEDEDGRYELSIFDWSFGEMNVPPYPEPRVYKSVARSLCGYADQASDVTLVVEGKALWFRAGGEATYDCASLGVRKYAEKNAVVHSDL